MRINIAEEYSKTPGGRYISEGKFSGEDFRTNFLLPAFEESLKTGEPLIINLDGGYGYGSSFLEEAFGGLARLSKNRKALEIEIISDEEPRLKEDIVEYMEVALNGKK